MNARFGVKPGIPLWGRTSASAKCRHWSGRVVRWSGCAILLSLTSGAKETPTWRRRPGWSLPCDQVRNVRMGAGRDRVYYRPCGDKLAASTSRLTACGDASTRRRASASRWNRKNPDLGNQAGGLKVFHDAVTKSGETDRHRLNAARVATKRRRQHLSKVQSVDMRMRLGMRCRLSPTADVPSHTSGAAMCHRNKFEEIHWRKSGLQCDRTSVFEIGC